jgi:RNA polymerase sigma-70 factor, ECF subfamily
VTSEHELIRRARDGDQGAFESLVAMHGDRVYGALRRFGLDAAEADEVAQEVFVRAWRGLGRFEERAQLSTWLYRIAFNEARRYMSRRRTGPAEANADVDGGGDDPVLSLPESPRLEPIAQTLDHEFERAVDAALAQLPDEWRVAVVLRDLEGLSTREAAEIVGVRQAAFKSRLHRGRIQLRALLEPYVGPEER